MGSIAKTDIDSAVEIALENLNDQLLQLTLELYRLNPGELKKINGMDLPTRITQITEYSESITYGELDNKHGIEAIKLALKDGYRGDRVFALALGITSMINNSYNNQKAFYFFNSLEPQKIYDSSVNLQVLHRTLAKQGESGLIDTGDKTAPNGVYALISKMTATQELVALIISDKTKRIVNKALHGTAAVFLPI